jgi:hypothetical protein
MRLLHCRIAGFGLAALGENLTHTDFSHPAWLYSNCWEVGRQLLYLVGNVCTCAGFDNALRTTGTLLQLRALPFPSAGLWFFCYRSSLPIVHSETYPLPQS